MTAFYTLRRSDVGRKTITAFGRVWVTSHFIGRVLPGDVGKRVYRVGQLPSEQILQVENDEQRRRRLERGLGTR